MGHPPPTTAPPAQHNPNIIQAIVPTLFDLRQAPYCSSTYSSVLITGASRKKNVFHCISARNRSYSMRSKYKYQYKYKYIPFFGGFLGSHSAIKPQTNTVHLFKSF